MSTALAPCGHDARANVDSAVIDLADAGHVCSRNGPDVRCRVGDLTVSTVRAMHFV